MSTSGVNIKVVTLWVANKPPNDSARKAEFFTVGFSAIFFIDRNFDHKSSPWSIKASEPCKALSCVINTACDLYRLLGFNKIINISGMTNNIQKIAAGKYRLSQIYSKKKNLSMAFLLQAALL